MPERLDLTTVLHDAVTEAPTLDLPWVRERARTRRRHRRLRVTGLALGVIVAAAAVGVATLREPALDSSIATLPDLPETTHGPLDPDQGAVVTTLPPISESEESGLPESPEALSQLGSTPPPPTLAPQPTSQPDEPPATTHPPAPATTTTTTTTPSRDRPPPAYASDGDTEVVATEGSWCWRPPGVCSDTGPDWLDGGTVMEIGVMADLALRWGRSDAPTEVIADLYRQNDGKTDMNSRRRVACEGANPCTIALQLAPGDYVLAFSTRWPEGSVVHSVRLLARP